MVPIIVYGKPDDNRFVRELTRILSPLGSCLHLEKNHLLIPSEKAQLTFLLYETPVGCTAEGGKGILILKQDVSPLARLSIPLNYPAIVDSGCENGLKLLQRLKLPAVRKRVGRDIQNAHDIGLMGGIKGAISDFHRLASAD